MPEHEGGQHGDEVVEAPDGRMMNEGRVSAESKAAVRRVLLEHYDRHQRPLPWRRDTDPYRILVSEIMLQQTRSETVEAYYGAWLARFPDVQSLADADSDEVMMAWEGLGYYRRARALHRAARLVCERADRCIPSSSAGLRELPGVGEYTAGAVASIAFGEAVPAIDGNVRRVLARLFGVAKPTMPWLRETAKTFLDAERPGDWNQALMELGATVCTPRRPSCEACPLGDWCAALEAGTQREVPEPAHRPRPRTAVFALAVLQHGRRALMTRRPEEGLLGGMWAFPERAVTDPGEAESAALGLLDELTAVREGPIRALPPHRHRFTHLEATYVPYAMRGRVKQLSGDMFWVDPRSTDRVALPVAQRRVLESLADRR